MVRSQIRAVHLELSANQKVLAEYILDHLEDIPFWSVHTLAREARTSTASVVRFAQRIGFAGYPAMRDDIVLLLKRDLNRDYVSRIQTLDGDVLSLVANQDVQDINDSLNQINRADFKIAVQHILAANRVYTAGLGVSHLMSEILAYQLKQVGVHAVSLGTGDTNFLEQLAFFEKQDVLVAFSYPPFSKDTIKLAELSKERGLKVIAITNKPAAPISFHANISLPVTSKNILYTNAMAAISVIINALATECAHLDPARAKLMLSHYEIINGISDEPTS